MNQDSFEEAWIIQMKEKVREKREKKRTNGEFNIIKDGRKQRVGKLQEKYRYIKERAEQKMEDWQEGV